MKHGGKVEWAGRGEKTVVVVVFLFLAGGLGISALTGNARALSTYNNLNGYAGNDVIYMTTGLSSGSNPYFLPAENKSQVYTDPSGETNAINLMVGRTWNLSGDARFMDEYQYETPVSSSYMLVYVPVAAAGSGNTYVQLNNIYATGFQYLSLTATNLWSSSGSPPVNILAGYDSGINVSGTLQTTGLTRDQGLVDEGINAVCSFVPGKVGTLIGWTCGLWNAENGWDQAAGLTAYSLSEPGNGTVYLHYQTTGPAGHPFASQMYVEVHIPYPEWMVSPYPSFTVTGTNIVVGQTCNYIEGRNVCSNLPPANSAAQSITIAAVPAVTLTGQVTGAGIGIANQVVNIQDTSNSTIYQVTTSAAGGYQFFAMPGRTYNIWSFLSTVEGSEESYFYTVTMPSSPTSQTQNVVFSVSDIQGTVSYSSSPISGATVTLIDPNGHSASTTTGSNGHYLFWVNSGGTYSDTASATAYVTQTQYPSVTAIGVTYTVNFSLAYNGGGCVLAGTLISTPSGGQKRVEQLSQGDAVLGYNVTSGSWVKERVTSNTATNVAEVVSINGGLLETTVTDQPLFVRNGTWAGWVRDPQNLTVGEQVYEPSTGSWVNITSLQILEGNFTVYDLRASAPNDFVANGVLADSKTR